MQVFRSVIGSGHVRFEEQGIIPRDGQVLTLLRHWIDVIRCVQDKAEGHTDAIMA